MSDCRHGQPDDDWWIVRINESAVYAVKAATSADAAKAAGDLWRAEYTPGTPLESGGGIWSTDITKLRAGVRLFELPSGTSAI